MKIEDYKFGTIKIGGKKYPEDVEVRSTGEVLSWWRKEGHLFQKSDLERAVGENPSVVVLGTGAKRAARVSEEAISFLKEKGIPFVIDETGEAVRAFNKLVEKEEGLVVGLFHLTC